VVVGNRPTAAESISEWLSEYDELAKDRLNNKKLLENLQNEIKAIETKISAIDEGAIEELKTARDAYRADKSRKDDDRTDVEINRRPCDAKVLELEEKWEQIKAADQKQRTITNRIAVSQDLHGVIKNTLEELQTVYMRRVSDRMNFLFLQMVGADPTVAGGVFKKAEITSDYDIKVLSTDNRVLDPDHELNGASKRALTLSFIWALTEVSGVIAPRIIDTPLGMMSGGVKSRVVEIISNPDLVSLIGEAETEQPHIVQEFQVILFLTRQEILMVEELLDSRAGRVRTLTNTASYPIDLLNDPKVEQPTIIVCDCNHRQHCHICARTDDDQYNLIGQTATK
jgi:DNA sulfur modification protein DndD